MKYLVIFLICVNFISCGSTSEVVKQSKNRVEQSANSQDESLDFAKLPPVDFEIIPTESKKQEEVSLYFGEELSSKVDTTKQKTFRKAEGYRVQIFSTKNFEESKDVQAKFIKLFPEEKIYSAFDEPYYKLRTGNFTSRYDASKYLQKILDKKFKSAWVVKTEVEIED